MKVNMFFINKLMVLLLVSLLVSCDKDSQCQSCEIFGKYYGDFHDVAGCYGCIPYRDTIYRGNFLVEPLTNDSIKITRSYDEYTWRFPASTSNKYQQNSGSAWGESFDFNSSDSLAYFYNRGGSGGYFRITFEGKK
jgi:hypothetical protein